MEQTMSATQARVHFGEVLRKVTQEGKRIIVARDGRPQAIILSLSDYEQLQSQKPAIDWVTLVDRTREQIRSELGDRRLPPAEEIIRRMREERDEQLIDLR